MTRLLRRHVRGKLQGPFDVQLLRDTFDKAAFTPRGIAFAPATIGGIEGETATNGGSGPARPSALGAARLFYVHGGGFVACSPRTHRPLTGAFARRGFSVFAPRYRLAPEHPFPAALDDLVAAWSAFVAAGPAVVAGDSAGGTLALGLVQRARSAGLPLPGAVALFSPGTDLLGTGESIRTNARRDAMLDIDLLRASLPLYVCAADPANPLVSPLYADLAGFPPLLMHVGADEILRDDSVRLHARAVAADVPAELAIVPGVPHVWQWADRYLPEARDSLDRAAAFLHRHAGALESGSAIGVA